MVQKISSHAAAPNGAGNQLLIVGHAVGIAGPTGSSPQALAVSWPGGLPANYSVLVTTNLKIQTWVTAKTATGFTINFDNGGTLVANVVDVFVVSG